MKDYMASGSFARGKEEKAASASMVFVGNINQSIDVLLKTSHLFEPFPEVMANDTAFLNRMHCYSPGWEITKYRPDSFTNDYGLITDYLSEFMREFRKTSYSDAIDKYIVSLPEQGAGKLIPEGLHKPEQLYTISRGRSDMIGVFKLETEMITGSGRFEKTDIGSDRGNKRSNRNSILVSKGK